MKFELLRFDVFDIKPVQTNSSRRERWCYTNYQMRSFHELFLREASVDKCIKCILAFSGKPHWLSPFLLIY